MNTLWFKNNTPGILTGVSIGCELGAAYFIAKGTLKSQPEFDAYRKSLDDLKMADELYARNGKDPKDNEFVDIKKAKKDARLTLVKGTWKNYIPAMVCMGISIGCSVGSQTINAKRIAGLGASAAAMAGLFKEYRAKVEEKYGDEAKELYLNLGTDQEIVTDDEGNQYIKFSKNKDEGLPNVLVIDRANPIWNDECPQLMFSEIAQIERYANHMLSSTGLGGGVVTLNQIREKLQFPWIEEGQVLGWTSATSHDGVNFNIDMDSPEIQDVLNGKSDHFYIELNIDTEPILSAIPFSAGNRAWRHPRLV